MLLDNRPISNVCINVRTQPTRETLRLNEFALRNSDTSLSLATSTASRFFKVVNMYIVWNILTNQHKYKSASCLSLPDCVCLSLDHKVNQCHDAPISIFSSVSAKSPIVLTYIIRKVINRTSIWRTEINPSINQTTLILDSSKRTRFTHPFFHARFITHSQSDVTHNLFLYRISNNTNQNARQPTSRIEVD